MKFAVYKKVMKLRCKVFKLNRRIKRYWSGNDNKIAGIGILVRKELYENFFEIKRTLKSILVVVLDF